MNERFDCGMFQVGKDSPVAFLAVTSDSKKWTILALTKETRDQVVKTLMEFKFKEETK